MSTQDPTPPSDRPYGEPPEAPRFGQSGASSGEPPAAPSAGQGPSGQQPYAAGQDAPGPYGQSSAPYSGGATPYGGGYGAEAPRNGMGVAALVVGIVALLLSWFPGAGLLGVVAIILGVVGLGRVRKRIATNRGMSIAGIVLGAIATVIGIVVLIGTIFIFQQAGSVFQECSQLEPGSAEQQQCVEENLGQR
jgi:hypothetical protein